MSIEPSVTGAARATVQPGSVTFLQRFGGSINVNVHVHMIFLEGVYEDRTAQGLRPRFLPQAPPTDAEIAVVLHTISQRVIRQLRTLGYLEAGTQDVVPTGYDPASDEAPEFVSITVELWLLSIFREAGGMSQNSVHLMD